MSPPNPSTNSEQPWTWPDVITGLRIVGSPGLVLLGGWDQPVAMVVLTGFLVLTEWLDGLLARTLGVESPQGARLDSVADVIFYLSMIVATTLLMPGRVLIELPWVGAVVTSYFISGWLGWRKFGCLPSYHTWLAKGSWLIVIPGIVCLVLNWTPWPLRMAMILVTVANVEAMLITRRLDQPQVDVPSYWHLIRSQRNSGSQPEECP